MKQLVHRYLYLILLFLPVSVAAESPLPPVFSHPAGTFESSFDLELTAGEGDTIYYTTNGRAPTRFTRKYEEGDKIDISGSMMVRARTYSGEGEASEVVTNIYSQIDYNVADFDSNLPLVIVHQFDDPMESEFRSKVYFSVIDRDDDGRARLLTDDLHLHSRSESNYRGSSSLQFPKKQFGVRLIDDRGENRNEPILGMPSENNWIMYAPYDDKTLMRNAIAYQLSEDMGRYAPRTRFVELFLHEGSGEVTRDHYHGVYMLVERVKWDDNRVNITKISKEDNDEPEITGGYIINYDRDVHFRSSHWKNTGFALIRPQYRDISSQQLTWISDYIGELESALFGSDFRDPEEGYAAYLDPGSFIDYHLITEVLKEIDGYRLSTIMHKDREGRMVMGPIWDFNISLGNVDYHPDPDKSTYYLPEPWEPEGWYYELINEQQYLNGWYSRLFEDADFEQDYKERWWELRRGPLSTEHITGMIRDYAELLDEAQERNFDRWPILGEYVWPNHFLGDTYKQEVDYIVNWIERRLDWIDSQMGKPPSEEDEPQLRYYWYFGDELANDTPLESLDAGYSLLDSARIRFQSALEGYPFEEGHPLWRKASMERRNRPTDINYRPTGNHSRPFDFDAMRALQIRQPFTGDGGENTMIFDLPTTEMENPVFRFAAMDEAAADALLIDYSTSEGEPGWTSDGLPDHRHLLTFEYQLYELDFSEISEVDDNPHFKIRIRFDGEDMSPDQSNRVTFNNFSLDMDAQSEKGSDNDDEEEDQKNYTFRLKQNYPNPFNPETTITYSVEEQSEVELSIYNVMGQRVAVPVNEQKEPGEYYYTFDATGLASGIYIYELRAGDRRTSRRMTYIK